MDSETIEEFYLRHGVDPSTVGIHSGNVNGAPRHFNVYRLDDFNCVQYKPSNRRDYYKISLINREGILNYANKGIHIKSKALLFSNPKVPYTWEAKTEDQSGYFCLFTEDFLNQGRQEIFLQNASMFRVGGNPLYLIEPDTYQRCADLFEQMIREMNSTYPFKYDLIRSYVHLLIHEAMKREPAGQYHLHANASERIAGLFLELLDRQFPIDSLERPFTLRSAHDYAASLSVHVNHLNHSVKEVTGMTTTEQIASRLVEEAKALLSHTDWSVSQVAYSLGFEHPANFNNFFKKQSGFAPLQFRQLSD